MSRKSVYLITASALIAAVALGGCRLVAPTAAEQPAATPIRVTITTGDVAQTITATGTISADKTADLTFETSGRIVQVYVDQGQLVAAGDQIAMLDDSDLADAVVNAEISLRSAQIQLEQAQEPASEAEIASARAALAQAQAALSALYDGPTDLDRQDAQLNVDKARNSLWSQQASRDSTKGSAMASSASIDGAEAAVLTAEVSVQQALLAVQRLDEPPSASAVASAEAQVASARSSLDRLLRQPDELNIRTAEIGIEQAEFALRQARDRLDKIVLRAPFTGVIISSSLVVGEYAVANQPVAVLATTAPLLVTARIDEIDVADLQTGQRAIVTFDALPNVQVEGELTFLAPQGAATSGIATYDAELTLEDSAAPLRLGMSANVEVIVAEATDVILAPNQALETDRETGKHYVTVVTATGTARREVQLGIQSEDYAEVRDGLRAGDTVELVTVATGDNANSTFPMGGGMMAR